jgi:hypothetical protein
MTIPDWVCAGKRERLPSAHALLIKDKKRTIVAIATQVCPALTARDQRPPAVLSAVLSSGALAKVEALAKEEALAAPRLAHLDNHISLRITRLTIESRDNLPWFIFHANMLPHAREDCKGDFFRRLQKYF